MFDRETVKALRELGIDIPDRKLEAFEKNAAGWKKEYDKLGWPMPELDAISLLGSIGMGNDDSGVWVQSSANVYAFDAEIYDTDNMYTLFLQGIASIVPGFDPKEVREETREYEMTPELEEKREQAAREGRMFAEGTTTVSFLLNGHRYERIFGFFGDWFDDTAISWINEVLKK